MSAERPTFLLCFALIGYNDGRNDGDGVVTTAFNWYAFPSSTIFDAIIGDSVDGHWYGYKTKNKTTTQKTNKNQIKFITYIFLIERNIKLRCFQIKMINTSKSFNPYTFWYTTNVINAINIINAIIWVKRLSRRKIFAQLPTLTLITSLSKHFMCSIDNTNIPNCQPVDHDC